MKTNLTFLFVFLVLLCFTGCNDEADLILTDQDNEACLDDANARISRVTMDVQINELVLPEDVCGDIMTYNLVAGKSFVGGTFNLANDGDLLYVEFISEEPWMIKETHVFLGQEEDLLVNKKGNPKIGQFTDVVSYDPWVNEAPLSYAIADLNFVDGIIYVIGHATIAQIIDDEEVTKSVFAEWEIDFEGKRWGGTLTYDLQDCNGNGNEADLMNTAEADDDPILEELTDMPACVNPATVNLVFGENNVAGTVDFNVFEDTLFVTYTVTVDEWLISEVHIDVGSDDIALTKTGNPKVGQFDYIEHLTENSDVFTFPLALAEIFPFEGVFCNDFAIHATLERTVLNDLGEEVIQTKSAFAEWESDFIGSKKGGYFELCLEECIE